MLPSGPRLESQRQYQPLAGHVCCAFPEHNHKLQPESLESFGVSCAIWATGPLASPATTLTEAQDKASQLHKVAQRTREAFSLQFCVVQPSDNSERAGTVAIYVRRGVVAAEWTSARSLYAA